LPDPDDRLERFFRPRAIAIVGATEDFTRINGRPLKFLLDKGYAGQIYPVNPKYSTLAGLVCYPSVTAIPGPVDLAIVAVPAKAVAASVQECVAKGVPSAVVFSSGFGEMGEEGRRLEAEVAEAARRGGLRLCGPNTLGFMNTFDRVLATFSQAGEGDTPPGPVAFVTQSGAFGTAIVALGRQQGVAFGYFVNSGNEADLGFAELLAWVLEDPRVKVVAGYIEGLRDGRRLLAVADRALDLGKPLVIAKVGRFGAGARAASSHTGSLAGSDRIYAGVFRQKGILRAPQEQTLLDLAAAFSICPLPAGRGLGIVTQSGGAGVLMADRAEELGLAVPELAPETQAALSKVVPAFGAVRNPVDITAQFIADPGLLRASLDLVLADPGVHAAIFYLGLMARFADQVVANLREAYARASKPLIVAWVAAPEAARAALREAGICMLPSATRAVDAVHGLVEFAERRRRRLGGERAAHQPPSASGRAARQRALAGARAAGARVLGALEAFELLAAYGVPVARTHLVTSADAAARALQELGGRVALKVESADLVHKTEADAIRLDVTDPEAARRAFDEVMANARRYRPDAAIRGVLVQEMASGGIEVVVGLHRDAQFGPVVMVGLGGVLVEALDDVAFRAAPLSREDARDMLESLRGRRVLEGARGRPPADVQALIDVILAVSRLGVDAEGLVGELDINPLVVRPRGRGAVAVDALVVVSPEAPARA
jgi:acetyltransferase